MGLWHTNGWPNLGQKTGPYNNHKKKRTCKIVDFAVPADHRINLKESEKKDKYLDLVRELKKTMEHEGDNCTSCGWCFWYSYQRIIKGTGGLGIRGRVDTIQTTTSLRTTIILRRVLETWEELLSLKLQLMTISWGENNNNNNNNNFERKYGNRQSIMKRLNG